MNVIRVITTVLFLSFALSANPTIIYKSGKIQTVSYVDTTYLLSNSEILPVILYGSQKNIPKEYLKYVIIGKSRFRFEGSSTIKEAHSKNDMEKLKSNGPAVISTSSNVEIIYKTGYRDKVPFLENHYFKSDFSRFPISVNNRKTDITKSSINYLILNNKCYRFVDDTLQALPTYSFYESGSKKGVYHTYAEYRSNIVDSTTPVKLNLFMKKPQDSVSFYRIGNTEKFIDNSSPLREVVLPFALNVNDSILIGHGGLFTQLYPHREIPWFISGQYFESTDMYMHTIYDVIGESLTFIKSDGSFEYLTNRAEWKKFFKESPDLYEKYEDDRDNYMEPFQLLLSRKDSLYTTADVFFDD